jgi:hypothetical protein
VLGGGGGGGARPPPPHGHIPILFFTHFPVHFAHYPFR